MITTPCKTIWIHLLCQCLAENAILTAPHIQIRISCVICFRFWFHVILVPSSSYFLTFIIYLVGGSVTISSKHPACTPNLLPWPILSCVQHNLKLPSLYFKWGDENSQSCALPGQWKQSDNPGASKHKNKCTSTSNVTTTITTTNSNNSSSRNDNNNSKQHKK